MRNDPGRSAIDPDVACCIPIREWAVILPLAVLLAIAATWPLTGYISTLVPAGGTDSTLNTWIMAWAAQRLPHGLAGFWTPPAFYPYPSSLAYSENLLGVSVFVAPILWAGGGTTLMYNVAFLLAYVVSAIGAYLLGRHVTGSRAAAAIGALAFVMMPYRIAQAGHLQVQWIGWMAIAFWALLRGLQRPSWSALIVFVAASVLQVLSNGYAAFQLAIGAAIIAPWALWTGARRSPRLIGTLVVAGALVLLALAPVFSAYQQVWADRGPATAETLANAADVATYLSVDASLPDARWLPGIPQPEGRLFPGVATTGLALLALLPAFGHRLPRVTPRQMTALFVVLAVVALLVSLGPEPAAWGRRLPVPSLYARLAEWVPLFQIVRVPARFGALVLLAVAILAAAGAARVLAGGSRRARVVAIAAIGVLMLAEGFPAARTMRTGVPALIADEREAYAWLANQPSGALLELPIGGSAQVDFGMLAQHAALVHGHPIVNGLSRITTPLQEVLGGSASPLAYPDRQAGVLPMLQGLGVRYVIVRPSRFVDPAFAANTLDALQADPRVAGFRAFGDVHVLWLAPDDPSTAASPIEAVPPGAFTLTASVNDDRLSWIVDGDPDSRWLSGRPQDGHEWLALTFDRPRDVARLGVTVTDRSLGDYPRGLRIESTRGGEAPRVLFDGSVLAALGRAILAAPTRPVMSLDLPPNESTTMTLRQTGTTESWYWSIDELQVWTRQ